MKTILVIDDDRVFRGLLTRLFSSQGWRIFEAEDGETGLNLAISQRPDVVICDLLMPRCNGFQVIRTIRSSGNRLSNTGIVVTTSSSYAMDRKTAMEAGADEYLVKPIKLDDLLKVVGRFTGDSILDVRDHELATTSSDCTKLRFWGVRGSIPTPGPTTVVYGGNTSCVEVQADGELIILDAGSGIRPLGGQLATEFKGQSLRINLLISHTHWDHIQGFPFFAPAYNPKNQVRVLAFEGAQQSLEATLAIQMESPFFPISMRQMPGNISIQELKDLSFDIGKVHIEATFLNHPGICAGYRLCTRHGSIAYLPDHEPFRRFKAHSAAAANQDPAEAQEFAEQRDRKLIEFIQGADAVILDAQYEEHEYSTHVGWGHSCVDDSVELAAKAEAKRLFLFHHDPSHDDARVSRMVSHAQELASKMGSPILVEAAREGLEVLLEQPRTVSVLQKNQTA